MLALTGALLTTLVGISLASQPKSPWYRMAQRIFWAAALLWVSGALGGIGPNLLNGTLTALLGLPGYAALTVIAGM